MTHMKNILLTTLLVLASVGLSSAKAAGNSPEMPRTLANARYVYVTSYDGGQFNPDILPEDRAAVTRVEDAVQKWGNLVVVYRLQDADIVLAVQSRPSEDVLAVYDAHPRGAGSRPSQSDAYLWRVMASGGLQKGEMPLFTQFEKAWDQITK
jgi:hypothetical protein